jgi:hypothetical protein
MPVTSSIADILDRAADLIEPEGAWTQTAMARDEKGYVTAAQDPEAVCWCSYGAILRTGCSLSDLHRVMEAADDAVAPRAGSIIAVNDCLHRTQAEVVAKLREAAALAREQGK